MAFIVAIGFILLGIFNNSVEAAVGDTIAQTFPDPNMAQAVANNVSGGDVNAVLTNLDFLYLNDNHLTSIPAEIGNLTGLNWL